MGKGVFYCMNLIVLDKGDDEDSEKSGSESRAIHSEIGGFIVLVASISSVYIFGYDLKERKCKDYKSVTVGKDVGSYLEIMQVIKHSADEDDSQEDDDDSEKISVLMSNVMGTVDVFGLNMKFEYGNGFINGLENSNNLQAGGMNKFLDDSDMDIPKPRLGATTSAQLSVNPGGKKRA